MQRRHLHSRPASQGEMIRAEIAGPDRCAASGVETRGAAPVFALCRALLAAGVDPRRSLRAYRGDVLALSIRSICEGARLELNGDGTGFRPRRQPDAASPVSESAPAGVRQRNYNGAAP
jgi:hypothetical protein